MIRRVWPILALLVLAGCQAAVPQHATRVRPNRATVAPTSGPSSSPAAAPAPTTTARPRWTVAAENRRPGTTAWKIRHLGDPHEIEGFFDRTSVLPGGQVTLHVSTTAPTWRVAAFRMGWYGGKGGRQVWASGPRRGAVQVQPSVDWSTRTVSAAAWEPSLTVSTAGWPPGDYLVLLTASTGGQRYVPFVVRSPTTARTVVVMNAVLTWQAYNAWGGYSLYHGPDGSFSDRAYAVSFDRPYDANGADKFVVYERPLVAEAERLGLPLSYETDIDVSRNPRLLRRATAVLSLGHDEYWTAPQRAAVVAARDSGTNLAFFGANEAYWQVRLADTDLGSDRLVVEYKSATLDTERRDDPQAATTRFRDLPTPEPEDELSGLRYECYPALGSYRIQDEDFWGFAGTSVQHGDRIPGLVGVEIDRAYPVDTTPRPIDVVAHSPVTCRGVFTHADSVYYVAPSRAGVFAAGTMHWTCVLAGSCRQFGATDASTEFVRRVTDNILTGFAHGPAGKRHPVTDDNLDALGEPTVNETGGA